MSIKQLDLSGLVADKLSKLYVQPKQLFVRGEGDINILLTKPRVGVVGTRTPTPYGLAVTKQLVSELCRAGVVVVSGLALGVDGLAHQASIDSDGETIAILPSGIERVYPSSHTRLAQLVERNGVLISEYPGDSKPRADQFIARNRLIAAFSDILVIPEAAERSGSLHTARFALEMGITVMAVPGNITSRLSAGTNRLISQGATPILGVEDILRELGLNQQLSLDYVPESVEESKVLQAFDKGLQQGSELQLDSGLTPAAYFQTMSLLEIKGIIHALGNDTWQRS